MKIPNFRENPKAPAPKEMNDLEVRFFFYYYFKSKNTKHDKGRIIKFLFEF